MSNVTSIDLKDVIYFEGEISAMYTLPVRRPLENPASRREPRRKYNEVGSIAIRIQEIKFGIPAAIKIFFGPKSC